MTYFALGMVVGSIIGVAAVVIYFEAGRKS